MGTILDTIVARVRADLEEEKQRVSLEEMRRRAEAAPQPRDFLGALQGASVMTTQHEAKLIAEVKKASPSKGVLVADFDPVALARTYEAGGASAISVLTERHFFQGSLEYLAAVRAAVALPTLRKDFIVDPYQVYQARASGADAVLLICAILDDADLALLLGLARQLGMRCLVEVHDEEETKRAVASGAEIIGINNRDLRDFHVDTETTRRLGRLIPKDRVVVSESGLHTGSDVQSAALMGAQAVLIGEALVTASDPLEKVRELSSLRIKICGLRSDEQARAALDSGAHYIGLVFYPPSPRCVTPEEAASITRAARMRADMGMYAPKTVGVFVNEPPETINTLAREVGLDMVQLSGDESPEVCRAIEVPVMKAVRPQRPKDLDALEAYRPGVLAFLLDTKIDGMWGGTGAVGNWSLAREMARRYPTLLAGGLTPENVREAVEAAQPWGVDVSSGVETNGQKDLSKIARFADQARLARRGRPIPPSRQKDSLAAFKQQMRARTS
ncbi:MAG TPA: bifunctional indole-3-glycerol-phosphate synthase TrpC/phosphoribosylanthranilate isomerase TrpF [Ktedonobacterales bacterium]|jgi:indole-3-glycerol phosphate synthase/phosphoribosylanthranilate isomerase/anthranilate synthase/indole-3-glycerol phosphate synthase/phosphoribosylanthranilate isomerase